MNSQGPTWTFSVLNGFSSADQNIDFVNSVDADETPQDLHCLPLCFDFLTETPIWKKVSDHSKMEKSTLETEMKGLRGILDTVDCMFVL